MFSLAQIFERYVTIHAPAYLRVIAQFGEAYDIGRSIFIGEEDRIEQRRLGRLWKDRVELQIRAVLHEGSEAGNELPSDVASVQSQAEEQEVQSQAEEGEDDAVSIDEENNQQSQEHVRTLGESDALNVFSIRDEFIRELRDRFGAVELAPVLLIRMHDLIHELAANMKEAAVSYAYIDRIGHDDPAEWTVTEWYDDIARDASLALCWQLRHERLTRDFLDVLYPAQQLMATPDSALRKSPYEIEGRAHFSLMKTFDRYATIHAPEHLRVLAEFGQIYDLGRSILINESDRLQESVLVEKYAQLVEEDIRLGLPFDWRPWDGSARNSSSGSDSEDLE